MDPTLTPPAPQYPAIDSLKTTLEGITDRREVAEWIDLEHETNPALAGLNKSEVGRVMNHIIGAPKGSRFEMFDSKTRWLDAGGYYLKDMFTGAPTTPTNYARQMRGEVTRTWGDVGGDVGESAGRTVGLSKPEDLQMWREAGSQIPAGLGTMALGMGGGLGLALMTGSTYGQSVNDAKEQGATGGEALAVGAIDTAVNLMFLRAGPKMTGALAERSVTNAMGQSTKAANIAAKDALVKLSGLTVKEGSKKGQALGGEALMQYAKEQGEMTAKQVFKAKLAAEVITEGAELTVGVAGEIANSAILDPEGLKELMANPNYWATTVASEGVFSVLGVTMGRVRTPNHLGDYAATNKPSDVPGNASSTSSSNAREELQQDKLKRTGDEAIAPLARDSQQATTAVAQSLIANGDPAMNSNNAQKAELLIAEEGTSLAGQLVTEAESLPTPTTPILPKEVTNFRPVYGSLAFTTPDSNAKPVDLTLTLDDLVQTREALTGRFDDAAVATSVGAVHDQFTTKFRERVAQPGVGFASNFTPQRKLGYTSFLEDTGLGDAITKVKGKLQFNDARTSGDWLDSLTSDTTASLNKLEYGGQTLFTVNTGSSKRLSDIHEMGHVMDHTLRKGGFGDEARKEWMDLVDTHAGQVPILKDYKTAESNMLGATVTQRVLQWSDVPTEDIPGTAELRRTSSAPNEWAAQSFTGYFLGKPGLFSDFMKNNFPELDIIFTKAMNSIRKIYSDSKKDFNVMGIDATRAWQPGQGQAKMFFDRIFAEASKGKAEATVNKLAETHNLTDLSKNSLIEVVLGGGLAGRESAWEAVATWAKEDNPTEASFLKAMESAKAVNKAGHALEDLQAPKTDTMANVRRMQSIQPDELMIDMLGWVERNQEKLGTKAWKKKEQDLTDYVVGLENLPIRGKRMLEAVDMIMAHKTSADTAVTKQSYYTKNALMLRVDAIMGQWIRGELAGQEGRPMWDKRLVVNEDYKLKLGEGEKMSSENYSVLMEKKHWDLKKEFPILAKHLNALHTGAQSGGSVKVDGGLGKGKRVSFEDLASAQAQAQIYNADSRFIGHVFKPKGETYKGVTKYYLNWEKDDRSTFIAGYRDDLKQKNHDELENVAEDPDHLQRLTEDQDSRIKASYYEDSEDHVGRLTINMFKKFRSDVYGRGLMPQDWQKQVLDYELKKKKYPSVKRMETAIGESLGLDTATMKTEHVLLGLYHRLNQGTKDAKGDPAKIDALQAEMEAYIHNMPMELAEVFTGFRSVTEHILNSDYRRSYESTLAGKIPPFLAKKPEWTNFMNTAQTGSSRHMQEGYTIMNMASPGGIDAHAENGVSHEGLSPRSGMRAIVRGIEVLHERSYAGAQNLAETHPWFMPLAKALDTESPRQDLDGNQLISALRMQVERYTDEFGEEKLRVVPEGVMDDKAYVAVQGDPRLRTIYNQIALLQNQAGGIKFRDILAENMAVGVGSGEKPKADQVAKRKELTLAANKLMADNFDMANPKHQIDMANMEEMLMRDYLHQELKAGIFESRERDQQVLSTAISIYKGIDFAGTPDDAKSFSLTLMNMDRQDPQYEQKAVNLMTKDPAEGGLGWDMDRSMKFFNKWEKVNQAIIQSKDVIKNTPGYTSEKRMRRYLVSYSEKGQKAAGTGLRDFDTAKEALEFMESARKPGSGKKLNTQSPIDTRTRESKYKAGADMLEEVVGRVSNARKGLLEYAMEPMVEQGIMTKEEVGNITKVLAGMPEEISADLSSAKLKDMFGQHRMYKAGREEMDMAFQREESGWRDVINQSRKITDGEFMLHQDDPRIVKDEYVLTRMLNAKESLRQADGAGQRLASKGAFSHFMAGNISSAMIEAVQWPLSLSHILVEEGSGFLEAFTTPMKLYAKAGIAAKQRLTTKSDASIWDPEHLKLIRYAELSDRLGIRPLSDISTSNVESKAELARQSVNPGAATMATQPIKSTLKYAYEAMNKFYAFFSRINAETSMAAAYDVHKKRMFPEGTKTEAQELELFEAAIRTANKANGSWGRGNRPFWFDSKNTSTRTVAQLGWSLQGFASNHIANHLRLMKQSLDAPGETSGLTAAEIKNRRRALGLMTTMQIGGLGVMGHTLSGGMNKLIESVFGFDTETELLEWIDEKSPLEPEDTQFISDLAMYGGFHAGGFPLDIQSRMSVSGLGPVSAYEGFDLADFGGPVLATAGDIVSGWNTIAQSNGTLEAYGRAATQFLPVGMQRAVRMEIFDDGKLKTKSGTYILTPDAFEKTASFMGFSTRNYTDYMKRKTKDIQANASDSRERKRSTNMIYDELFKGGSKFTALSLLESEAKRVNLEPRELAGRVAEKHILDTYGPQVYEGTGPQAQKAARQYGNPLPQVSNVTATQSKLSTLAMLNQTPRNAPRQMFDARMQDALSEQYPGLSRAEVKEQLRDPRVKQSVFGSIQQSALPAMGGLGSFAGLPY